MVRYANTSEPDYYPIVHDFKSALEKLYGARLQEVVLHGSYARSDYDDESDSDLFVVLNDNEINTITEVFTLSDLTLQAILQHGKAISALPVSGQRYRSSSMPVYQNTHREGMRL